MNKCRVGAIVIVDRGILVGMFTERDVLRRIVGAGLDPSRTLVSDVMTSSVFTVSPNTTMEDAMEMFTQKRCRHLPVISEGRLLGVISIGDITRWMTDQHRAEAEHLKNYISGSVIA